MLRRVALASACLVALAVGMPSTAIAGASSLERGPASTLRWSPPIDFTPSVADPVGLDLPLPALSPLLDPVRVLDDAEAALAGGAGPHGATPALEQLAQVLPYLRGSARRRGESILARPTDGPRDPLRDGYRAPFLAAHTTHFCYFWVERTRDRVPSADSDGNGFPDYVDYLAGFAEHSYRVEHGRLGFRKPRSDGRRGCAGPSRLDLYLVDLSDAGLYGYATIDPGQRGDSRFGYMVLDNDMENLGYDDFRPPLAVTMAHEYNHILQNAYAFFGDKWAKEATSTWVEEKVYPQVNDYLQYVLGTWRHAVEVSLTSTDDVKVYGDAVWNHFLSRRYGIRFVRDVWAATRASRDFSAGAYDRRIRRASGGRSDFLEEFVKFAASTAEWRTTGLYPDHSRYRDVDRSGSLLPSERFYDAFRMDNTTFRLLRVPTSGRVARLELLAPRGTGSGLALVARKRDRVKTLIKVLRRGGKGTLRLAAPRSYSRITAVIVNGDIDHRPYNPRLYNPPYVHDNELYQAAVYGR